MRESFIKYLQFEKRYSPHTIQSYHNDLLQLEEFLTTEFDLADASQANHNCLRAWIIQLSDSQLQPRTINRKIASAKAYYRFLLKQSLIEKDPTSKIKSLKTNKRLPQFVSEESMSMLLDHSLEGRDFNGLRDRLVIELLYGTGIRLAELINLRDEDINTHNQTIKVLGKRNKERIIPYSKSIQTAINEYINERKSMATSTHNYLITTDKGRKLYPMFVYRIVKRWLSACTTIEKRSPHVMRHTFATHLLNKGAELNAVKDLLGHTSLAATQVYTHNSMEKLKAVFDQAHPKA